MKVTKMTTSRTPCSYILHSLGGPKPLEFHHQNLLDWKGVCRNQTCHSFAWIHHGFHHGFIKHISHKYPESLKLSNWDPNGIHSLLECCSSVDIHFLCWHCHKSHCELQSKNGLCCKALFASLLVNSPGRWCAQKYQDKTQPGSMANKNTTFCCNDETPATPLVAPTTLSFRDDWLDIVSSPIELAAKTICTTWHASININNFPIRNPGIYHILDTQYSTAPDLWATWDAGGCVAVFCNF